MLALHLGVDTAATPALQSSLSTVMLPCTNLSSLLGYQPGQATAHRAEGTGVRVSCNPSAAVLFLVIRELLTPSKHRPPSSPYPQNQNSGTCAGGLRHARTIDPCSTLVRDHHVSGQAAEPYTAQPAACTGCPKACGSQPEFWTCARQPFHSALPLLWLCYWYLPADGHPCCQRHAMNRPHPPPSSPSSPLSPMCLQALDTLALHLGPKMVLGPSLAFARQGISSSSRDVRWAACTVALVVTEGCADGLRKRLPEILQVTECCTPCWQPG